MNYAFIFLLIVCMALTSVRHTNCVWLTSCCVILHLVSLTSHFVATLAPLSILSTNVPSALYPAISGRNEAAVR